MTASQARPYLWLKMEGITSLKCLKLSLFEMFFVLNDCDVRCVGNPNGSTARHHEYISHRAAKARCSLKTWLRCAVNRAGSIWSVKDQRTCLFKIPKVWSDHGEGSLFSMVKSRPAVFLPCGAIGVAPQEIRPPIEQCSNPLRVDENVG
jgi:hypothetical protein